MTVHEKRIREALEADAYLTANVAKDDLRALLADLDEARAALTAAKAGGWVAVPVEPTEEMLDAAFAYETQAGGIQGGDVVDAYKAMLAARPLPTPPKEQACPPAPATPAMSAQARPRALLLGALSLEST